MKKKTYTKPSMQVIELHHQSALLIGSDSKGNLPSDDEEVPEFDDWLG